MLYLTLCPIMFYFMFKIYSFQCFEGSFKLRKLLSTATYCVLSLLRKMNYSVLKLTPLERNTKSSLTAIKRKDSNARQIEDIEFSVMLLKLLFVWELGENEIVSLSAEQVFAEIGY